MIRCLVKMLLYFNPRPPRGGRPIAYKPYCHGYLLFQSTPPARGATIDGMVITVLDDISIHAPREGGDEARRRKTTRSNNFNPRPPRGGRRNASSTAPSRHQFQSTPPARGATLTVLHAEHRAQFQSTPPARGATTRQPDISATYDRDFNPRPPRGGRLCGYVCR